MIHDLQVSLLSVEQYGDRLLAVVVVQAQVISTNVFGRGELVGERRLAHSRAAQHRHLVRGNATRASLLAILAHATATYLGRIVVQLVQRLRCITVIGQGVVDGRNGEIRRRSFQCTCTPAAAAAAYPTDYCDEWAREWDGYGENNFPVYKWEQL